MPDINDPMTLDLAKKGYQVIARLAADAPDRSSFVTALRAKYGVAAIAQRHGNAGGLDEPTISAMADYFFPVPAVQIIGQREFGSAQFIVNAC